MKKLLTILFICLLQNSFATTYYFSSSTGSDGGSGTGGSPYASITKLNTLTLSSGDNVLFKRGDTFYGTIKTNSDGVTYGAYGSGANPIITGFTSLTSWSNLGSNIWETTTAVSTLPTCNIVLINGLSTPMGRFPNGANNWFPYQAHNYATSITSSSLDGVIDWTGATVAIRRERWYTEMDLITSQTDSSTLNFTDDGNYHLQDNWGFFIENDVRTLDMQNEWYYNPSTKKLRIYSTSMPTNVQIPTVQNNVQDSSNSNFITIQNLSFTGANLWSMDFNFAQYVTVSNCTLSYGQGGIALNGYKPTVNNTLITDMGYSGISSEINCIGGSFIADTILRTCMIEGTLTLGNGEAIHSTADSSLIERCVIDSAGWTGINIKGSVVTSLNNFVNHFDMVRDDGAGIGCDGRSTNNYIKERVINCIVINGIGNDAGTSDPGTPLANGIYFDDLTSNAISSGNTVAFCKGVGQFIHRGNTDTIVNNLLYNNSVANNWTNGQLFFHYANEPIYGMVINNNTIVATNAGQNTIKFYSDPSQNLANIGAMDNNIFYNLGNTSGFLVENPSTVNYNLSGWQTLTGGDAHSTAILPKTPASIDSIKLVYNATTSPVTTPLDYNYTDAAGNNYNGSITLQPFTSALLVQNGSITSDIAAPTVSASSDQSITTSYTSVSSTATPAGEHSVTYLWSKTSGGTATISTPTSANTNITNLVNGNYTFRITVTQDDGQTAYADVNIAVAIPNQNPVANAGSDISITLPTNSVTLSGSGTDADGTVSSYLWTKISGTGGTITSSTSASTTVTGLTAGTYQYQLQVTDNQGATGTDMVQVVVNPAPVIAAPTANAGTNQTITLPISSINLSGSYTTASGHTATYLWTKVSGSGTQTITNNTTLTPTISGFSTAGTYVFQLQITQDDSQTATSTVTVTVNSVIVPTQQTRIYFPVPVIVKLL